MELLAPPSLRTIFKLQILRMKSLAVNCDSLLGPDVFTFRFYLQHAACACVARLKFFDGCLPLGQRVAIIIIAQGA
jgi:hypothetical protein